MPTLPSRRDLLRTSLAAGTLLPFASLAGVAGAQAPPQPPKEPAAPTGGDSSPSPAPSQGPYLEAALRAARWLHSNRIETPLGVLWPNTPALPDGTFATPDLYHGNAGVILFLLELARASGDKAHFREAALGGDYLAATVPKVSPEDAAQGACGLYTGVAGMGAALTRLAAESGKEEHRQGAERCRDLVHGNATAKGAGVEWGETTDIVSGAAGTGLYLLERARKSGDGASLELALRAAQRLNELGIAEGGGRKWRMDPQFGRLMPNFSHGTAGIGYFFASLYLETRRPELLAAALDAGRYLPVGRRFDSRKWGRRLPDPSRPAGQPHPLLPRLVSWPGRHGALLLPAAPRDRRYVLARLGAQGGEVDPRERHPGPPHSGLLEQRRPVLRLGRGGRALPRPPSPPPRRALLRLRPPPGGGPPEAGYRYPW